MVCTNDLDRLLDFHGLLHHQILLSGNASRTDLASVDRKPSVGREKAEFGDQQQMSATGLESDNNNGSVFRDATSSGCTYCGLPVTRKPSALGSPRSAVYCCYGCRFAHAVVQEQGDEGAIRWTVIRLGLAIFFAMNLMAFTMTMWSLDVYDVEPDPFQQTLYQVFRWLSMLLAFPVLLLLGVPLLQNAVESWRRKIYSTDLLVGLAVIAAYCTSVVSVVREVGPIYFEVGATVLVMITLGRWIEATGKQKATESLDKLLTLLPETVAKVDFVDSSRDIKSLNDEAHLLHTEAETVIATVDLRVGDTLHIRAGERFPADAVIRRGTTMVDEQMFTGESQPIAKLVGDQILAGTVNIDGDLLVDVTAEFKQGSFGRLLSALQQARSSQGYHQRLADRVAAWFFPLVTLIAVGAFVWHFSAGIGVAIHTAMSVLLIACPCALGLATPLAIWTALSTAVKHQVLFRSGEAVERLATTKAVCLDKTGTLTTGTPHVFQTAFFEGHDPEATLQLAQQLADSSRHPFSKAVSTYVTQRRAIAPTATERVLWQYRHPNNNHHFELKTVSGGGVEAKTADGRIIRLGSVDFSCCKLNHEDTNKVAPDLCVACKARVSLDVRVQLDRLRMAADQQAASIVLLSIDRAPAAGFLIAEEIRPEAAIALRMLIGECRALHILSGDRPAKGRFLREQLNVEGLQVECRLNPEQKVVRVAHIRQLHGTTVMVGDGINDAPALAASDVGIAMGCGADVSRDSADVCLLSNDLTQIPWAINLARRTRAIIRQNLFWAFGYNAAGVCLAAAGFLNPAIAAGLMIASSLLVISNSLRLLRDEPEPATAINADNASQEQSPPAATKITPATRDVLESSTEQSSIDRSIAEAIP